MTTPNRVTEIVEKLTFPCINKSCDNQGTIIGTDSDGDPCPEQCEYCYRERFPFQDELTKALTEYGAEREARGRKMAVEKLVEYTEHTRDCVWSQFSAGRPTDDGGYEQKFAGKWYRTRPVDERPKCNCGLDDALTNHTV